MMKQRWGPHCLNLGQLQQFFSGVQTFQIFWYNTDLTTVKLLKIQTPEKFDVGTLKLNKVVLP